MALDETVAYDIFAAYFVAIFVAFGFVVKSITSDVPVSRLLEGRPFLFLRIALGALLCTWYCESRASSQASSVERLGDCDLYELTAVMFEYMQVCRPRPRHARSG